MRRRASQPAAPQAAAAAAARMGISWFAAFGLLFQIFLVASHIHVDEDGWVGLVLPPGVASLPAHNHDLAFHRHDGAQEPDDAAAISRHRHHSGDAAGQSVPANANDRVKHPDCQICQSSPVVSASFIASTIAFAPATVVKLAQLHIADVDAKRSEARTHVQPRAPPYHA